MMDNLRPLTQEQRQAAHQAARQAVVRSIGPRPVRERFAHHTISRYPPTVTRLISVLCIILLLAAFTPSAIRLYVIGSQTFGQAVSSRVAMTAVGLATVLSAEVGQVVFSLALATLGTSRSSRRLLYTSMAIATTVSLIGNIQVSLPGHTHSPFAWLESIAPPVLVLSTAYVLKEQVLESIEQRHADERAFQAALAEWQAATASPEQLTNWPQVYANALRDALLKANSRRKEALGDMTVDDWRLVVYNEPQNEQNGQEGRKTNEQYVVLPGHPFYGCPVRVLKHTAGYCTIEDPAHPEFRYEMLVSWLSASPPPPQAPSIAMHDPIPLLLSALDRLVQIIVLKDQQMKDSANERASESSRPVRLGPTTTRTQNSVEGPTILSDTEPDRREGA
jgi:hypothetical protein